MEIVSIGLVTANHDDVFPEHSPVCLVSPLVVLYLVLYIKESR